ncbi:unnamed protein product [Cercospora beticola]|nr:unnamed protein product [Cercospora beticola]
MSRKQSSLAGCWPIMARRAVSVYAFLRSVLSKATTSRRGAASNQNPVANARQSADRVHHGAASPDTQTSGAPPSPVVGSGRILRRLVQKLMLRGARSEGEGSKNR